MPYRSFHLALATIALATFASLYAAPLPIQIDATIKASKVGDNSLEIRLKEHEGKPLTGAKVTVVAVMPAMEDMHRLTPAVQERGEGLYTATLSFPMEGKWKVDVKVEAVGLEPTNKSFEFIVGKVQEGGHDTPGHQHGAGHQGMDHIMHSMKGRLGNWSMSREGSGTSWMPEASPMFMRSLGAVHGFDLSLMGTGSVNFSDAGGRRGESQFFSNSMAMLMARRELGSGTLGLSLMASLDPLFNGKRGYPNLFQTGETANGRPLQDRQHPHDLIAELAATYSHPLGKNARWFIYGGPVGEPALGGPMFMHRPSGMENPEAPISHHWFDSTHITFGVLTGGFNFGDRWQVEGSWFNGREPNEERFDIDPIRLNSGSGRITFNPNPNWSFQASYGFLKEPEILEPGVNQHRLTASAMYSRSLSNDNHLAATAFFGQNIKHGERLSAWGLEATWFHRNSSFFGRFESVDKDELVNVPHGIYKINKLVLGATHDFAKSGGFDFGVGGFVGFYSFPSSLEPFYGRNPVSFGVFLRVRPSRM